MVIEEIELREKYRMQYAVAFQYLSNVVNKLGADIVFGNNRYKRYKELFIGAILAQTLTEADTQHSYHYVASPDNDPPDIYIVEYVKHDGDQDKTDEMRYSYEMVEYTQHSQSIEEVIHHKLAMNYPENYGLVVYFRNPNEDTIDFDKLRETYSKQNRLIWVIAKLEATKNGEELWVVQSLSNPFCTKIIEKDYTINPYIAAMFTVAGRGRDSMYENLLLKDVRFKLPD